MDSVVGLPDKFRLPDEFESVDVAIGAVERIICLFGWVPDETLVRCFGDEQSREGDAITRSKISQFNFMFCQRWFVFINFCNFFSG